MAVFPTLDFTQIRARYPKAVKEITEWIFDQPELSAEFVDPKHPEESKEQFTGLLIQMDPRKLYDIFDSFNIYVNVKGMKDSFTYSILTNNPTARVYTASSRHEAEQSAFHDAFDLFEKQL